MEDGRKLMEGRISSMDLSRGNVEVAGLPCPRLWDHKCGL